MNLVKATTVGVGVYKIRPETGPRSLARFKPEVQPISVAHKCTPEVHYRNKLTNCPEHEQLK